jgi:hypothetical protein
VTSLLRAGMDPDAAQSYGRRALCLAVQPGVVAALLAAGASPILSAEEQRLLGSGNASRLEGWIAAAQRQ